METYQEYREKALKHIMIADHMLVITYPLVNDPKLLLTILENISESLRCSVRALLHYELLYKKIDIFQETPEEEMRIFKEESRAYGISKHYLDVIEQVRGILKEHKESPMEFARKETFVICGENYTLKTLSEQLIKTYITKTKEFNQVISTAIKEIDQRMKAA
ncbi:MAG: hypothetical protein V1743_00730 [Nanoarchaeota archaeon]